MLKLLPAESVKREKSRELVQTAWPVFARSSPNFGSIRRLEIRKTQDLIQNWNPPKVYRTDGEACSVPSYRMQDVMQVN